MNVRKNVSSVVVSLVSLGFFSSAAFAGISVPCNDSWEECGYEISVRCEGANTNLFTGSLDVYEPWTYEYEFMYDGEYVCDTDGDVAYADTAKVEIKCTDVLKGNGKNSTETTVEMEMKYDESKDDCD